jgi:hypothetical protein
MTAPTQRPMLVWEAGAAIIPFPLVRRRELIERTARNVAFRGYALGSRDPQATGEKLLAAAIKGQRETMERRGVDLETIERELQQFEAAVRVTAARLLAEGGGAA